MDQTSRALLVNIPHTLGRQEAVRRLKRGLERAGATVPFVKIEDETWSGDRLTFKVSGLGQQASGTADVTDSEVRVSVVLPWLMERFAEMVKGVVQSRAQILLEKK